MTDPTGATAGCAYDPDTQDRLAAIDGDGRRVTYAYTAQGQVMSRTTAIDGKLNTLLYDYYGFGESSHPYTLKQTGRSLGPASYGWTTLTHDAAGNVIQSVDADGKTMGYLHSPMDRLLAQVDGAGRRTTHGYDLRGNATVTVDPLGHRHSLVYDGNSRLRAEIDPLGYRTTHGYDLAGNHTLTLDAENAVWKDTPSPARDQIASTAPVSGTTNYAHDGAGRVLTITDPSNRITSHGYDLSDRLTQRIDYPSPGTPEVTGMQYTNRDELMAHTDPTGVATTLGYYDSGLVKQHTVAGQSGPAIESHTYAGATDPKNFTDALGRVTSYGYDESGRRIATQDALGFITTSVYSPAGDLLATINPRGAIVTLGYDESHRRVSRTASPRPGLLQTWTTVYDDAGRVISEVAPDGASHGYGYFDNGWIQVEIDALGGRTSYTYNNRGQARTVADAEGRVTTHLYDGEGRQTGIVDPAGFITTTLYDNSGNPNVSIDPLGNRTTHLYDGANRPWVTQVSPKPGVVYATTTIYDGAGRVSMVYNADATTVGYDYQFPLADGTTMRWDELGHTWIQVRDKARNILSDIDANGNRTAENHYDALQRMSYTQKQRAYALGPSYATRSLAYDAAGNTTAVIDGLGRRSTTLYDFLNRVTTRVRQAGPGVLLTESQDYDPRGNLLYTLDARGKETDYAYDANNRLVWVRDPLGGVTTTVYDRTGRRIAVQHPTTDAGPGVTSFVYDPRGLLTSLVHADGSVEQFSYDGAGRQKTHILASGKVVTYLYDGLGRQTQLIPPDSRPSEGQEWDSRSRRTSMVDGTGRTVYLYYDDGHQKAVQRPEGILTYTYDAGGRRTALTYAPGTVWYGYDPDNNLATLTSAWGEVTGYAWDLAEQLTTITIANGSIVSLLYDGAGRLVYKGDPDPSAGIGFLYGLDPTGNRVTITENDGSQTVNAYDDKNRLLQETRTGTSAYDCGYAYDLNGSMIARDLPGGGRVTFTLDNAAKITGDSLANNYVYDPDGRLTSRQGVLGTLAWDYDYAGRVVTMLLDGPTTLAYRYDGDGRLQRLYRNGAKTWFLLDGRDVLREGVATIAVSGGGIGSGSVKLRPGEMSLLGNFSFPAISVAAQEIIEYTHGVGLVSQRVTQTSYFRWDGRSTGRRMEDAGGADSSDAIYDAYGLLRSPTTLASAYGFVGEEGVRGEKAIPNVPYHMRARMYDPLLGRFVSRDPVWDSNLYEYAKGNPWWFVDPDGSAPQDSTTGQDRPIVVPGMMPGSSFTVTPESASPPAPARGGAGDTRQAPVQTPGHHPTWEPYIMVPSETGTWIYAPTREGGIDIYAPGQGYMLDTGAGFEWDPRMGKYVASALPEGYVWTEDSNEVWRRRKEPKAGAPPPRPLLVPVMPPSSTTSSLVVGSKTIMETDRGPNWPARDVFGEVGACLLLWGLGDFSDPKKPERQPDLNFGAHDALTRQLTQHAEIKRQIEAVKVQLRGGKRDEIQVYRRGLIVIDSHYFLYSDKGTSDSWVIKALHGTGVFAEDVLTGISHGLVGNLTASFLGTFEGFRWVDANPRSRNAIIHFHVWNITGLESATRVPFLPGNWSLRNNKPTGTFQTIREDFIWDEYVSY